MGSTPDATAARAAVAALRDQMTDAYQARDLDDGDHYARLAGQIAQLARDAHWMRDAAIVLARRAGVSWSQLEQATATPDATLVNRRNHFLKEPPS